MHIVEAWGTGIPRVITSCKQYGLQEPVFEEFGDGIKATVYRLQANSRTSEQSNKRTSEQADNQANKKIRNQTSETQDKIKEYLETVNDASSAEIAVSIFN
jgi:predicted HTH transcriptional regulator